MGMLEVKDRVQRLLTDIVGTVQIDRDGDFTFEYESTRVFVGVHPWEGQDLTIVRVSSIPVWEMKGSPELFERVATEAGKLRFGALSLFKRDDGLYNLNLAHNLIGDTLDPDELKTAVLAVTFTSDDLDDEYSASFGGKRWADLS
jgi:hypothetical protein